MRNLLFFILSFISIIGFNQKIMVEAKIDQKEIKLAEQTIFSISVQFPDSLTQQDLTLPLEKEIPVERIDTSLSSFLEIIEFYDDTLTETKNVFKRNYIITSWEPGMYLIDSMEIKIGDLSIYTNPTYINVVDIPVDTAKDIVDIKEIYLENSEAEENLFEDSWLGRNWIWLTIILTLLIAGVLGWYFYFRKDKEIIEIRPELPAHQIALQKLSSLKKKDLIKKGKEKEYYSEIAEIIRVYLENRYQVKALELTTNEIINRLKFENVNPDHKFSLREILETADLVKFAKAKPSETDNENVLFKAEEFVRNTKHIPEESTNENVTNE